MQRRLRCQQYVVLLILTLSTLVCTIASAQHYNLIPVPASITLGEGSLTIDSTFAVSFANKAEPRLASAAQRMVQRLARLTGILLHAGATQRNAALQIYCRTATGKVQSAIEDESYTLDVTPEGAHLSSPTPYGVLRGLETFLQLVRPGEQSFIVPAVRIQDKPRFPWRGVLIDVCRHWMPIEVIKRNLDAMAAVKLNVFHWHLSEDQGFRVESKRFPKLHELGSDGFYFTQDQVREVIAYARDRGIRVVPEFDMPGHSTAWFVGYPELASAPGPYAIERHWGIFDPTMDPTREEVYRFLDRFIGEMALLFPDRYFHIGGDEVTGKHWDNNPKIAAFKTRHGMKTNHDLHVYFNKRLAAILRKHGKIMVGWDEILHPDLPTDIVVQSWRGQKSLADAARKGSFGILSWGYYLDHMRPASFHYLVDPLGKEAAELPEGAQAKILGGEVCQWGEFITPETIDSRMWPRAAVIAERFWSPAGVRDLDDMYRRLAVLGGRLDFLGLMHRSNYAPMLERLTDHRPTAALRVLSEVCEPVKFYERPKTRIYSSFTPLNRLVDATRPESDTARVFADLVSAFLADSSQKGATARIRRFLTMWKTNNDQLQPILASTFLLDEVRPLSERLSAAASVGLRALDALEKRVRLSLSSDENAILETASKPQAELLIMVIPSIKKLTDAAGKGP